MRSLLQFLHRARQSHLQFLAGTAPSPVYVIGNASADLDSIISAIVYSYCADNRLPTTSPRPHVPLVNLPTIPSGPELYRLRPEFVTALWLSTQFPASRSEERFEETPESAGALLREHVVTVADFAQALRDTQHVETPLFMDATLVDWNAMSLRSDSGKAGRGALNGLPQVEFRTLGCIDHHVDEGFMPRAEALPAGQPLVIHPGPGSCASLVANEMERRGLWGGDADEIAQVAQLALAAVLIDTSNLTAEGKVTSIDVQAVELLRRLVESRISNATAEMEWDVEPFYRGILETKQNSLDLLTLDEILDRDFKEWTETAQSSGERVKLGFCSSVKPMQWIVRKAGGPDKFLAAVRSFAMAEDRQLDMVIIMTAFTAGNGRFCRELFVCSVNDNSIAVNGAKRFVSHAAEQLGLVNWSQLDGDISPVVTEDGLRDQLNGDSPLWRGLWVQTNVAASRKQVAPLLRTAMTKL